MRDYFCGWYFKCQSDTQTLAVIAALHKSKQQSSCSVQLITNDFARSVTFPYSCFREDQKNARVQICGNVFGRDGLRLSIRTADCTASGSLRFGPLSPIRYDIMGPFRYLPFMECRHSVFSMKHTVNGELSLNGVLYRFQDAVGYIEGDRGYSFPKVYAWTQCCFENGSLMLSVADIPIGPFHFTGVIGVILYQGTEYRLATYLGARTERIRNREIVIRQGKMLFSAKLKEQSADAHAHPLLAPVSGEMCRTIHESASCRAAYRFEIDAQTVFSFESPNASFEYEYPY